ncbi:MAG: acyl-CoA dehydrogenase family protein [Pseudomonadota bacterium]|nr:acyl-CoA dehydrogenase family protein [Pseudomonadota bacterium]
MLEGITTTPAKAAAEATLVEKARAMVPALKERAHRAESHRRISKQTNKEFRAAGFYAALQPARYGGLELDYGAQTAFARELGRGCASSGWVGGILACHGWIAGMFPDEAQAEIWGDNSDIAIATSFLPVNAKLLRTRGGLNLTGRWRFSSGVDYCGWAILLVMMPPVDEDQSPDPVFVLVNLASCKVEDAWNSAGLAATGSNDILVDNVNVPRHRLMRVLQLRGEETPGSRANNSYLYRLPLFAVFPFNILGPALGAARGALESTIFELTDRQSVTGADLSRLGTVHQRIGKATALLDAAEALIARIRGEIVSKGRGGEDISMIDRARYRLSLGHIAQNCCDTVDLLLPLTGGRGLENTHPMQRAWRDVHAIAQHIGLVWDVQTGVYGNVLLGHGSPDPKL